MNRSEKSFDEKWRVLRQRMLKLKIYEKDLDETFVRSQGAGGQNVNKVATCVDLYYRPDSVRVKCQDSRLQRENRYLARVRLCDKIEESRKEILRREEALKAKRRRQSRRRSKLAKEKMLDAKKMQARKKADRRKIRPQEY